MRPCRAPVIRWSALTLTLASIVAPALPVRATVRIERATAIATSSSPSDTVTVLGERSDGRPSLSVRVRYEVPFVVVGSVSTASDDAARSEIGPARPRARSHPFRCRPGRTDDPPSA